MKWCMALGRMFNVNKTLSIAIPTYKRAHLLTDTLNAFLPQSEPHGIPVCISYTDDTDQTELVIQEFRERYPLVTVISDPSATNIDRKIISAISLAQTRYVWLFGDDDLPAPGSIDRVLGILEERDWGLLVLNASSHDSDFSSVVEEKRIRIQNDVVYAPGEHEVLLRDTASYTTFLGGLVFEKTMWDSEDPTEYLDTDYAHVSILYRSVVGRFAKLVADPQLRIRLAKATWTSRYFEVELVNWPKTVWGLPSNLYSNASKASICEKNPTASLPRLLATRAYGYYGFDQYCKFIANDPEISTWKKIILRTPLLLSERLVSKAFALFKRIQMLWGNPNLELTLYRLKNRN
jgi:glycosyltransferase involved in cell wall biosynthesis